MAETDDDRRHRLAVIATALGEEVVSLRAAETQHSAELRKLRKEIEKKNWRTTIKIRWMITLVILDLVLSGAMLVGYLRIQDLIHDQEVVRSQVLCPLYSIFVDSYNPNSLAAKSQGIDAYTKTFDDIKRQYAVLRCHPR